jgi:hypothetical protein
MDFVMLLTEHLCYTNRAEIGLLCGFCFKVRQLNIVQYSIRPLSASATSAGFSEPQVTDVLR